MSEKKEIIGKYVTLADYDGKDIFKQQKPILPEALFGENRTQPYTGSDVTIVVERVRSSFCELLVDRRVVKHILSLVNEGLSKQKALFNDRQTMIEEMQEYIKEKQSELVALDKKIEQANGTLLYLVSFSWLFVIVLSIIAFQIK